MPAVSRYGRIRKMSRRADEATGDSQVMFFAFNKSPDRLDFHNLYTFLFQNLVDPVDMWRYKDEEPTPALTKGALKKIASEAWNEAMDQLDCGERGEVIINIEGDRKIIMDFLDGYQNELNERECNQNWNCYVKWTENPGEYEFTVFDNQRIDDSDEDDECDDDAIYDYDPEPEDDDDEVLGENHDDECAECGCDISEEADVPIQCLSNSKGDEKVVCNECYEENRTTYYEKGFLEGEEIANTNECCNDAWRQGRPTRLMVNEDKHEHLVFPVCSKCECEARANGFTDYEPDDE